jgi:molecular chaperone HscB
MAQMEMREQLDEAESLAQMAACAPSRRLAAESGREFAIDYRDGDWSEAGDTVRKMHFMSRLHRGSVTAGSAGRVGR